MRTFWFIGLIIWTFATSINLFWIKNPILGSVYLCYAIANVLLYTQIK